MTADGMRGLRKRLEEYEVRDERGELIGGAVPHPRMEGYWLAVWAPHDWRDCGIKRYKTRSGAIARVRREKSTP